MINFEIINLNALEALPLLPEKYINCCVTSPPYFGLRDYNVEGQLGSEELHDCLGWATKEKCGECFVCHMMQIAANVHRVLRDDGAFWLNLGDSYAGSGKGGQSVLKRSDNWQPNYLNNGKKPIGLKPKDLSGIPWRVALALQSEGWYLRRDVIWEKPGQMPENVDDRPTTSHEYVFLLTKNARYYYDAAAIAEPLASATITDLKQRKKPGEHNGETKNISKSAGLGAGPRVSGETRNKRSVWTINTEPFPGGHFAVFPRELPRTCILATCPLMVCSECHEPYKRVVIKRNSKHHCRPGCGCKADQKNGKQNWQEGWQGYGNFNNASIVTNEFKPQCDCNCGTRAGIVLDPFSGAGTTGVACRELGVDYIGIELNPEFAKMSEERIKDPYYEQKIRQHQKVERENQENLKLFN